MEMLEPIALPEMTIAKEGPCWFCTEKQESGPNNKEDESPASPEGKVAGPENSETNDSSELGKALGSRPKWTIKHKVDPKDPIDAGDKTEIVPAAHHLLPGGASVNKAALLHKYMLWKGKNPLGLSGPIGYDINSEANGVWLPGNYAVREGTDFKKNWGKFQEEFKTAYAKAAMKNASSLQLHDAHPEYNKNVLKTLQDTATLLDSLWVDRSKCPICKKKLKNQNRPPYGLVGRLNRLSAEHQKPLEYPENNRKAIRNGYITSSRVTDVYG